MLGLRKHKSFSHAAMSNTEKTAALSAIANGVRPDNVGKSKFRIRAKLVHVRFCSEDAAGSTKF